jgi:hypothetical protein
LSAASVLAAGDVVFDPLLVAAQRALHVAPGIAADLDISFRMLRRLALLEPGRLVARALRDVPPGGLWRFVRRRLTRAAPRVPDVLRGSGGPLTLVGTGRELMAVGRRFRNCVGAEPAYLLAFAEGRIHFGVLETSEPLIVGLVVDAVGRVWLDGAAVVDGPSNCPRVRDVALALLVETGVMPEDGAVNRPADPFVERTVRALERLRFAACAAAIAVPSANAEDLIGI